MKNNIENAQIARVHIGKETIEKMMPVITNIAFDEKADISDRLEALKLLVDISRNGIPLY